MCRKKEYWMNPRNPEKYSISGRNETGILNQELTT
jgi:hypothetical protein